MSHCSDDQKPAYFSLACLRYSPKPLFTSGGELPRHQSKPRRKITPATKGCHCRCESLDCQCNHRADTWHGLKTLGGAADFGTLGEFLRLVNSCRTATCEMRQASRSAASAPAASAG